MVTLSHFNKIRPGEAVIYIDLCVTEMVVFCVFGEQFLLIDDTIAVTLHIIVTGEPGV